MFLHIFSVCLCNKYQLIYIYIRIFPLPPIVIFTGPKNPVSVLLRYPLNSPAARNSNTILHLHRDFSTLHCTVRTENRSFPSSVPLAPDQPRHSVCSSHPDGGARQWAVTLRGPLRAEQSDCRYLLQLRDL